MQVGFPLYEALYRKRGRSPLCWEEIGKHKMLGAELVQHIRKTIDLIRKRLVVVKLDRRNMWIKPEGHGIGGGTLRVPQGILMERTNEIQK